MAPMPPTHGPTVQIHNSFMKLMCACVPRLSPAHFDVSRCGAVHGKVLDPTRAHLLVAADWHARATCTSAAYTRRAMRVAPTAIRAAAAHASIQTQATASAQLGHVDHKCMAFVL